MSDTTQTSIISVLEKYQIAHPDLPELAAEIVRALGDSHNERADVELRLVCELAIEYRRRVMAQYAVADVLDELAQAHRWAAAWKRAAKNARQTIAKLELEVRETRPVLRIVGRARGELQDNRVIWEPGALEWLSAGMPGEWSEFRQRAALEKVGE